MSDLRCRFQAVLFDLDGTLTDTLEDLTAAVNHALRKKGFPARSGEEVRSFVGNGLKRLADLAAPASATEAERAAVYAEILSYYPLHCTEKTAPYPGIAELLSALKKGGARLAVVTNKADGAAKSVVERYFPEVFSAVVGEREGLLKKPAREMVDLALSLLGASPETACYVGDSEVDVLTAKAAEIPCMGVSWGFRGGAALQKAGATEVFDAAEALQAALLDGTVEEN